jgi:hypothetical protein
MTVSQIRELLVSISMNYQITFECQSHRGNPDIANCVNRDERDVNLGEQRPDDKLNGNGIKTANLTMTRTEVFGPHYYLSDFNNHI